MKKTLIKIACFLFPSAIVNVVYKKVAFPQIKKLRPHEIKTLGKAEKEQVDFNGIHLQTYRYNNTGLKIFMVHGWEGHGGNFADIIEVLIGKNYHVFTFDAPSHGESAISKNGIFDFPNAVKFLMEKEQPDYIISHSFGAVATTYALHLNKDISIKKYVLLSNPDRFLDRINFVAEKAGITHRVKNKLIKKVANETGQDLSTLSVSDFVQKVSVEKALILHDKNDRVQPQKDPENVNKVWSASTLEIISGTGHFKILRTQFVIDRIITFFEA